MLMINCKVELKLRWTNHSVLAFTGVENDGANSNNNIIFPGIESFTNKRESKTIKTS